MAMPAIQALNKRIGHSGVLHICCKKGQAALWKMHPDVDQCWSIPDTMRERRRLGMEVKSIGYSKAIILPNSFRSAWLPFRAGIPVRRGTRSQLGRRWSINDPVSLFNLDDRHQQWENARLLVGDPLPDRLPSPRLIAPEAARSKVHLLLEGSKGPHLGLIPGAARGPSKQWPAQRFQAVATEWIQQTGGQVCWMGTPDDTPLCEELNASLGQRGTVLAGRTTLQEFAAALSCMDVVLANDSGGMHLATAMGTPVVGIFGITDPAKTGPLSDQATVLQHSDLRNRRVPRESEEATAALAAVSVKEATEAVLAFL
jgi:heptosyltransferase-2